ncbi:hypothetical protein DFS34DRAFT_153878 [Phlyctochytrium arcticum]|nr:hypothetical protein DFS34DRAFT_153878 [Phlyctochytrium arcticum]
MCTKFDKPLFSADTWKKAKLVLEVIYLGYLSDPEGIPLYYQILRVGNFVRTKLANPNPNMGPTWELRATYCVLTTFESLKHHFTSETNEVDYYQNAKHHLTKLKRQYPKVLDSLGTLESLENASLCDIKELMMSSDFNYTLELE